MNKFRRIFEDVNASIMRNNKAEGFLIIAALFLIPAVIAGLTFGSYGIYKSLQAPKHSTDISTLVEKAKTASNYIDKQFQAALNQINEVKSKRQPITEPALQKIAETIIFTDDQEEQKDLRNDIKLAMKTLNDYSSLLNKQLDSVQRQAPNKKKYITSTLLEEAGVIVSVMNTLRTELNELRSISLNHSDYFDAYKLEQKTIEKMNQMLTNNRTSADSQTLKKAIKKQIPAVTKRIDSYPELKQRLTFLEGQMKEKIAAA